MELIQPDTAESSSLKSKEIIEEQASEQPTMSEDHFEPVIEEPISTQVTEGLHNKVSTDPEESTAEVPTVVEKSTAEPVTEEPTSSPRLEVATEAPAAEPVVEASSAEPAEPVAEEPTSSPELKVATEAPAAEPVVEASSAEPAEPVAEEPTSSPGLEVATEAPAAEPVVEASSAEPAEPVAEEPTSSPRAEVVTQTPEEPKDTEGPTFESGIEETATAPVTEAPHTEPVKVPTTESVASKSSTGSGIEEGPTVLSESTESPESSITSAPVEIDQPQVIQQVETSSGSDADDAYGIPDSLYPIPLFKQPKNESSQEALDPQIHRKSNEFSYIDKMIKESTSSSENYGTTKMMTKQEFLKRIRVYYADARDEIKQKYALKKEAKAIAKQHLHILHSCINQAAEKVRKSYPRLDMIPLD
jgi:hypothetical protein